MRLYWPLVVFHYSLITSKAHNIKPMTHSEFSVEIFFERKLSDVDWIVGPYTLVQVLAFNSRLHQ